MGFVVDLENSISDSPFRTPVNTRETIDTVISKRYIIIMYSDVIHRTYTLADSAARAI